MHSRRALERALESVEDFRAPSAELEQYLTPPAIAAHVCHLAQLQGDLRGRTVVDLGTGTGMLAIGAAVNEPTRVVAIDIDDGALRTARRNEGRVDTRVPVEWVRGDVGHLPLDVSGATILSNPPFGAQRGRRGADRPFLEAASRAGGVSYTIHNEGSQSFVESFAGDRGGEVTHAFRATVPIERRFEFHDESEREIHAEVFRVDWSD